MHTDPEPFPLSVGNRRQFHRTAVRGSERLPFFCPGNEVVEEGTIQIQHAAILIGGRGDSCLVAQINGELRKDFAFLDILIKPQHNLIGPCRHTVKIQGAGLGTAILPRIKFTLFMGFCQVEPDIQTIHGVHPGGCLAPIRKGYGDKRSGGGDIDRLYLSAVAAVAVNGCVQIVAGVHIHGETSLEIYARNVLDLPLGLIVFCVGVSVQSGDGNIHGDLVAIGKSFRKGEGEYSCKMPVVLRV